MKVNEACWVHVVQNCTTESFSYTPEEILRKGVIPATELLFSSISLDAHETSLASQLLAWILNLDIPACENDKIRFQMGKQLLIRKVSKS